MLHSEDFSRGSVTLSDSLRHDASAVLTHLKPILDQVLEELPENNTIHFLSDGPSTQYRNKTMFYLISQSLPKMYPKIKVIIYYSEAGHGKGAADGIGGSTKRIMDCCVTRGEDIYNLDTAVAAFKRHCKNLMIDAIFERDIIVINKQLPKNLSAFTGTLKVHPFKWVRGNSMLKFNSLSCYSCAPTEKFTHYAIGEKPFNVSKENPVPVPRKRKAVSSSPKAKARKKGENCQSSLQEPKKRKLSVAPGKPRNARQKKGVSCSPNSKKKQDIVLIAPRQSKL